MGFRDDLLGVMERMFLPFFRRKFSISLLILGKLIYLRSEGDREELEGEGENLKLLWDSVS